MQPSEMIWLDGALVPWDEARVHVTTHSLHYGNAVFEGIRAYATPSGPAVLQLDRHVRRMFQSCAVLDIEIPFGEEEIRAAILETVRRNGHGSCYIRPLVFRGAGALGVLPKGNPIQVMVATWEWASLHGAGGIETGVDVGFSSWRRMAPGTHPSMAKASGNYLNSQLVVQEAIRHGYAEGLVLDVDGYLSEGSGENVFLVQDGRLLTPPIGNSILAGITRGMVIQLCEAMGLELREARIPREAVFFSDEMFMTGTAAEITPVRSVDGKAFTESAPGPVTRRLQDAFFGIVRGAAADRFGWLTPVGGDAVVSDETRASGAAAAQRTEIPSHCENGAAALSATEVTHLRGELQDDWSIAGGMKLQRRLELQDFQAALDLTSRIGALAEEENHHPDLAITNYKNLTIALTTHDAGGLTANDFCIARRIDALL